jgi:hypothetical protein
VVATYGHRVETISLRPVVATGDNFFFAAVEWAKLVLIIYAKLAGR